MNFEQAKQDIIDWVTEFIEIPNESLNGWAPCPYARKFRLLGQFDIRPGQIDPYTDLQHVELGNFMVIAYVYDRDDFESAQFEQQIRDVNQGFLIPRDILALADHPDSKEEVLGVCMNQGEYAIAFVQPLSKLNNFARAIASRGYYNSWPEDYLQELFKFRKDPRS